MSVKAGKIFRAYSGVLAESPRTLIITFAVYFLLQTLIRLFLPTALRVDEAQQVLFQQWLALGYDAQPPLYNWYQQIFFALFGPGLLAIGAAKNLVLFLIFFFYVKTAELVLTDRRLVAVAAVLLFVIPQVFWQAQRDLTHTTMLMLSMTMLLYVTARLFRQPSTPGYLALGVCIGMALLSKYNSLIILPAILAAAASHPEGRARILDRRLLLSLAIALILCVPHALWLFDNLALASEITLKRMAENAPDGRLSQVAFGFATFVGGALVIACVPVLLTGLSLVGLRSRIDTGVNRNWYRFFRTYFAAIALVMLLVISTLTLTEIRDRWLLPLFLPLPLFIALWLEQKHVSLARFVPRLVPVGLVTMLVIPVALIASQPVMAMLGLRTSSNYDWQGFAEKLRVEEKLAPSLIVTGDWRTGGNLRFLFRDTPVVTTTYDDFAPQIGLLPDRPILLVQITGRDKFPEMLEWLETNYGLRVKLPGIRWVDMPMSFPTEGKTLRFNYAVVRPSDLVATPGS
ncbi:glycosyltransferase family 39 protein [Affinirhizobium pseudoryzae]|uniref:glycosyltransferase family 39 protein n=1 Tax=Allorhizobium pseudoryzae TaxID=379684 RepID=UPI0013ED92F2|nr:glycosyltransferase family 39 protein [Allorhizobium pseudoryzae]